MSSRKRSDRGDEPSKRESSFIALQETYREEMSTLLEKQKELEEMMKKVEDMKKDVELCEAQISKRDIETRKNITSLLGMKDTFVYPVGFYDTVVVGRRAKAVFHVCLFFLNEDDAKTYIILHPSANIKTSTGYDVGVKRLRYHPILVGSCESFYKYAHTLRLSVDEEDLTDREVTLSTMLLAIDLSQA